MRFLGLIAISFSIILLACNSSKTGNTSDKDTTNQNLNKTEAHTALPESKLNDAGTQTLMAVVDKYYKLKNALVATDAPAADSAAARINIAADSFKTLVKTDSNGKALKPYIDTIIAQSSVIKTIDDKTCEKQRTAFSTLSNAVYGLINTAGLKHVAVYHDFCPMAMDEKGAFWLSEMSEIKNPYYGKKMIECGEVRDSLQ